VTNVDTKKNSPKGHSTLKKKNLFTKA